jgi:SRSO17 transposase
VERLVGAEHAGDRSQRLPSRASWDEAAAMSQVRKYVAAWLDETGREKQGTGTGVKRQYMGCAGRVQDPGAGRYRPRST